jgi:hypothetical protein
MNIIDRIIIYITVGAFWMHLYLSLRDDGKCSTSTD